MSDGLLPSLLGISPTEIARLLRDLRDYLNRDKNYACLGLSLVGQNIEDWYNDLVRMFSPEINRNLRRSVRRRVDLNALLQFSYRREYVSALESSDHFLEQVRRKIKPRLGRRNDNVLVDAIRELDLLLTDFSQDAISNKKQILSFEALMRKRGSIEDAALIKEWLERLDTKRGRIKTAIFKIQAILDCQGDLQRLFVNLTRNPGNSND